MGVEPGPTDDAEKFEDWVSYMGEAIEDFLILVDKTTRSRLDYTVESLAVLEAWLIEQYPNNRSLRESPEVIDGASRYFGETFRKIVGGCWRLELEDPDDVYYEIPQISEISDGTPGVCPLLLIDATVKRRTGSELADIVDAWKDI